MLFRTTLAILERLEYLIYLPLQIPFDLRDLAVQSSRLVLPDLTLLVTDVQELGGIQLNVAIKVLKSQGVREAAVT